LARLIDFNVMMDHPVYPEESTPDTILRVLAEDRVERAVIGNARPLASLDFDTANGVTADLVSRHREKVTGLALVNPQNAEQVNRALNLGLKGIKLYPNFIWIRYGPLVEPAVQNVVRRNGIIHFSVSPERVGNMRFCAEVCAHFPEARVIMGQIWNPWSWNPATILAKRYDNLLLEIGCVVPRLLEDALKVLGPSRFIVGSGLPYSRPAAVMDLLKRLQLSEDEIEQIAFVNAARILKE